MAIICQMNVADDDIQEQKIYIVPNKKDIEEINEKYMNLAQNHEKEKIEMKEKMIKTSAEFEKKLNMVNQEKHQITVKYENSLN